MKVGSSEIGDRSSKVASFEDLDVWKSSVALAKHVYIFTKGFPKDEIFALTNQIKRSSTSVSANIAEGFGRQTAKDKLNFYHIAYGSLLETKNFAYLAVELGFAGQSTADTLIESATTCQKLVNGLIRSTKARL